jgi:hypothetical protein
VLRERSSVQNIQPLPKSVFGNRSPENRKICIFSGLQANTSAEQMRERSLYAVPGARLMADDTADSGFMSFRVLVNVYLI